jgi:tetratricopeptide (TPR) repeat protein
MNGGRCAVLLVLLVLGLGGLPSVALALADEATVGLGIANTGTQTFQAPVNIGIPPAELPAIIEAATKPLKELTDEQRRDLERVRAQLEVSTGALDRFLRDIGEAGVPSEEQPARLAEIAARHKELLARVERTASSDPRVQILKEKARAAIEAGKYDDAERLLNEAKEAAIEAARRLKEEAATQLRAAAEAVAENGDLAMTRLRYREAAGYFAEAVELLPEGSDGVRADYLNQQGNAAWQGGDYRAAVQAHRTALNIREHIHPPDDPELAYGLNHLAVALNATGRYAEAEPLYERAIAIGEKTLGAEHPELAAQLNNLAELYRDTGRYAEAEPLYERALAIGEKTLGAEHPELATGLNNLAELYRKTGRYTEAEPLYRRALTIFAKALPAAHPHQALLRENYALFLDRLGRGEEAAALRAQAAAPGSHEGGEPK